VTLPDKSFEQATQDNQDKDSSILENQVTEIPQQTNTSDDETALSLPQVTIRKRLPWLLGNIMLYILAASAISPFQSTISDVPILAVIMPVISNTSGNVAIQAVSVTLRGLGVGEITPLDTFKVLRKEIIAACATSLALGITLGILSLIWAPIEEYWISIVTTVVMIVNVFIAASLGTLLPMTLKRFNLDPALISGPLLTTTLDAIGFFTFLSMISIASYLQNN
jgi:magnesium transporter